MTWIIIIAGAIVFFLLYNSYKGMKDIKYVEKSGGLRIKYQELIDFILTNEKLKLKQNNSNNIEIGYTFIGNGHVKFKLTEMSKNLMIRYQSKDNVDGIQNLAWKFNEDEPQSEMIAKISKDMFVHTQILKGLSKNEALQSYLKLDQAKRNLQQDMKTDEGLKIKNSNNFNDCLGMFLELYNELTEKIRTGINEVGILTQNEISLLNDAIETNNLNIIKDRFVLFNRYGRFNDIIDDYLVNDSDIEPIAHLIIDITLEKRSINPNFFHMNHKLETKHSLYVSYMKNQVEIAIKRELFLLNSVKDFEQVILKLISTSENNINFYSN